MTTAECMFDWCTQQCTEQMVHHTEHKWTDGVNRSGTVGETRRAYVWTSLEEGYSEPVLVGVEEPGNDSYCAKLWLSIKGAEHLREALTKAIEHAREAMNTTGEVTR